MHCYEVRPRPDHRGFDLISDQLPFGRLWYTETDAAMRYVQFFSRAHALSMTIYDASGAVLQKHEYGADFSEP